jgi:hypothetical protein
MPHLHRFCLTATTFLLLAACTTFVPSSPLTTPPSWSPSPVPTAVPAAASPSPTPTAAPATASPSPTPKPTVLRVAYSGGGHIMLWTEGKGSRSLGDARNVDDVRISDDGQVIAYIGRNSRGIYEIWAVNADGTNQHLLAGQDYVQNIQPVHRTESCVVCAAIPKQ